MSRTRLRLLITKRVATEMIQIVVVSGAIGLLFNAANPIGVRRQSPLTLPPVSPADAARQDQAPTQGSPIRNYTLAIEVLTAQPRVPPPPRSSLDSEAPTATTWSDVKPLLDRNGTVLVDARPRNYFDAGHIPGAVSLPESSPESVFASFRAQHDVNTLLVVYCGSPECPASKRLAQTLVEKHGYRNVRYLPGGYQEWQRAALSGLSGSSHP